MSLFLYLTYLLSLTALAMYSRDNEKKICAPNDTDMRRVSVIQKRESHADPKICSMNINNIVITSRYLKKYSSSVHNGKFQPLIVIVTRSTSLDVNQILLMLACQKIRKRSVNFSYSQSTLMVRTKFF